MTRPPLPSLLSLVGIEFAPAHHAEKIVSGVGALVGIMLVMGATAAFIEGAAAAMIVGSMGASAVLLFATPHGPLAQPWPVIGGHLLSAFIGVACHHALPSPILAAPAAVGLSITAMYYARCLHPPGGATALTFVIGGPNVHALGYSYILWPIGFDAFILLAAALAVNNCFAWRRYPAALHRWLHQPAAPVIAAAASPELAHEHLVYALKQMGSMVDVSEADLTEIYALALHHARGTHLKPEQIRVGRCYANSPASPHHAVRQIVDELRDERTGDDLVLYWTLAGETARQTAVCPREAFALWASAEVPPPTVTELSAAFSGTAS